MKLRTFVKIAITTSVALLCTGFVVFSFFKLSAAENKEDFELYALVPPTATVVFETDDMCALVQEINELNCSRDNNYLYISKIFSYLKLHLYTLLEDTPHGLSRQMSKMLLSFHEPDNDRNQVLYCALGSGDYELVENSSKNIVRVHSLLNCLIIKEKKYVSIPCRAMIFWLVMLLPVFWLSVIRRN